MNSTRSTVYIHLVVYFYIRGQREYTRYNNFFLRLHAIPLTLPMGELDANGTRGRLGIVKEDASDMSMRDDL